MPADNRHAFRIRPGMRQGFRSEVPLPTRLVSNEEFRRCRRRRRSARWSTGSSPTRVGWPRGSGSSRRDFLRTSGGMAASLLAMNAVFGRFFDVLPVEAAEPPRSRRGRATRSSSSTSSFTTWGPDTIPPMPRPHARG